MAPRLAREVSLPWLWLALAAAVACGSPARSSLSTDTPDALPDGGPAPVDPHDASPQPNAPPATRLDACGDDNPAGLDDRAVSRLRAGGEPGSMRFIYPYDRTVFPRGLSAPVLMWDGDEGVADAVHVHMTSSWFRYDGCLVPDAEGRVSLPQDVWEAAAAKTLGKGDPFTIELRVLHGDRAKGPIRESLIIAPGSLKGSVFYNSYSSVRARESGAAGGAVLRIRPGHEAEVFLGQRACAGCHAASADGTRLVTNEGVYALTPDVQINPNPLRITGAQFAGLTPDGSLYALQGALYETDTGTPLLLTGLSAAAQQATFSVSGTLITFLDGLTPFTPVTTGGAIAIPVNSQGAGKLATMRFDPRARTFSSYRDFPDIDPSAQWPAFLPDDKAIVFADARSNDLMIADLETGKATLLARAMGFDTPEDARANRSNLPFGSMEARQAFFPTVAPVAAGGYFWVYFDSPRRYGNFDTTKIESGLAIPNNIPIPFPIPIPQIPGLGGLQTPSKQLWVTAIEIAPDGSYARDPSSPAFYLPGQEMGANNHRAFSSLDPCRELGAACESGTECCGGFCSDGECVPPPERCSETEEACSTQADCCDAQEQCIGGYCSIVIL